jgi:dGTPase
MIKQTMIWPYIERSINKNKFEDLPLDMKKYNITRSLINLQITNLTENTVKNINDNSIDSVEKVRKHKKSIVEFNDEMKKIHKDLKSFLYKNFYKHYKVIRMEYKAEKIIEDLFVIYEKRGQIKDKRGITSSILPPEARKRLGRDSLKRVICDYIAGMTDRFILEEYKKLFDPNEKV